MKESRKKLVILVRSIGPYHNARFNAMQEKMEVHVIETRAFFKEYDWDKKENINISYTIVQQAKQSFLRSIIFTFKQLRSFKPNSIFTHGWADVEFIIALIYGRFYKIPVITGCDSTITDYSRNYFKEKLKSFLANRFDAILSAGKRSDAYLYSLKVKKRVFHPYDVVDNDYFSLAAEKFKKTINPNLPSKYILCIGRFIEKKNILSLIMAYNNVIKKNSVYPYDLVIVGSGELKDSIINAINIYQLNNHIKVFSFAQYSELPKYYAKASTFIIPSKTDQWGLVVNEAMSCSLPVLVSKGCGCADDLVNNNENGFVFEPEQDQIEDVLIKFGKITDEKLDLMGSNSKKIIQSYSLHHFVNALIEAINTYNDVRS